MDAQKVVRRFLAATLLAPNVKALIREAEEDERSAKKAARERAEDEIERLQDKWTKNLLPTLKAVLEDSRAAERLHTDFIQHSKRRSLDMALDDLTRRLRSAPERSSKEYSKS